MGGSAPQTRKSHESAEHWAGAMRAKDLDVVRTLPPFGGLDDAAVEALTYGALLQRLPRETTLFEEGDAADFLHVLVDGSAMLSGRDQAGQETVIEILKAGDCFVPAAVLTDAPYLMSAKVLEPSQVLMLPAPVVRELVMREPKFAQYMLKEMAGQFRGLVREVKDLKLCTTTQRLAAFILAQGSPAVDGMTFELPVSKRILASRLGMTPEQLSRALGKLSRHDLHISGGTIQGRSIERLRRCCHQRDL